MRRMGAIRDGVTIKVREGWGCGGCRGNRGKIRIKDKKIENMISDKE